MASRSVLIAASAKLSSAQLIGNLKMAKSARYRSIRTAVIKDVLALAGFMRAGGVYVRAVGGMLHGIDFQTAQWGKEYTVNLAFHFLCLPALGEFNWKEPADFELLDFLMHSRLGSLLNGTDTWWRFDDDFEAFESQLRINCTDSLAILDSCSREWSNPNIFLDLVPPPALITEVPIPGVRPDNPAGTARPLIWDIFPGWQANEFGLAYLLCSLALKCSRFVSAIDYAKIGVEFTAEQKEIDALNLLRDAAKRGLSDGGNTEMVHVK